VELTNTTQREAYAAHLEASHTTKFGTNPAIKRHAEKVAKMNETEWVQHRATLLLKRAEGGRTAKRLASQLFTRR
jgi:hypothetical protein